MSAPEPLTLERLPDGVAVLRMDVPGEPVNTLKADFSAPFRRLLEEVARDRSIRALVFTSGKPDSFLAGADIGMLQAVTSAAEAEGLSRDGQGVMDQLEALGIPVVAAIHGVCLGGGLELALACHARVASDDKKTKLGLPEVQLGLLPGAGGTQRLPALIGVQDALDLMLTGRQLDARQALKRGLVDEVVPAAILEQVAVTRARSLADHPPGSPGFSARLRELFTSEGLTELGLEKNPLGRKLMFDKAREATLAKTHGNYPAPERILHVVRVGLEQGRQAGLAAEARAFGELAMTPEARELMGIYFATTALKKDTGVDGEVEPRPVARVGVLGAGLMGAGIAYVTTAVARTGARLRDVSPEAVGRGLASVRKLLDERVTRRRMTALERDQVLSRLSGTTDLSGFQRIDVVIEAVFEDLNLKHRVLQEVEQACGPDTIFASNTSSLPITDIARASARPQNVIGMHYFSPVHKMPLLEIIVTDETADAVTATCVELGKRQGKTVIVVRDGPGFYTSRILAPYMNEAAWLLAEGAPVEAIDAALVAFGFPVGPVVLLDEVGIDVGAKVGHILCEAFGERMLPPPGMDKLVADQRLGRKNGRGFYRYEGKKKGPKQVDTSVYGVLGVTPGAAPPAEEIAWRCTLQMVNEAVRCFEEGILRSARDGDIGAVFGLGFPPFRGGPFRLVDALGSRATLDRLRALEARHGARFAPARLLEEMAAKGATFYGEGAVTPPDRRALAGR